MKINVNDTVRLKLTGAGRAAIAGITFLKPDDDGWLDIQLWEAMYVFGPKMFHGNSELPFETNIELKPSVETIKHEVAARCDKPLFPEGKISQGEIALLFPDGLPVELMKVMFPEMSEPLTSDEIRFLMKFVALDRQYEIGPKTLERVFNAAGLVNMSDLQAVLDAVERALTVKPLEWERYAFISRANWMCGDFMVQSVRDGGYQLFQFFKDENEDVRITDHPTREAAEQAAQALHNSELGKYLQG